jgi:hypothetical protein
MGKRSDLSIPQRREVVLMFCVGKNQRRSWLDGLRSLSRRCIDGGTSFSPPAKPP